MDFDHGAQIRRSISMPVKPRHLEPNALQRSKEKEKVFESADYYPESPIFERGNKYAGHSISADDNAATRSVANLPFTSDWVGSTIELNVDSGRKESDPLCPRKRPYRVIEKNGHENVSFRRIPEKSWRFIRDFVTTLVRPLLRFLPKKCIKASASDASVCNNNNNIRAGLTAPSNTSLQLNKAISEQSDDNLYKITPSIERKLNELETLDRNLTSIRRNDVAHERVTFSLYS